MWSTTANVQINKTSTMWQMTSWWWWVEEKISCGWFFSCEQPLFTLFIFSSFFRSLCSVEKKACTLLFFLFSIFWQTGDSCCDAQYFFLVTRDKRTEKVRRIWLTTAAHDAPLNHEEENWKAASDGMPAFHRVSHFFIIPDPSILLLVKSSPFPQISELAECNIEGLSGVSFFS